MSKSLPLVALLALVLFGPIALRPKSPHSTGKTKTVIIITPHNEATRSEFAAAFRRHYLATAGQDVIVDYRTPGGTSEIARYVSGGFFAAFQNYWTNQLHHPWNSVVERNFANAKPSEKDDLAQEARTVFLNSNVGCNLDLFFGGGSFEFQQQANAGYLVDCGLVRENPDLFNEHAIPQQLSGQPFWDPEGRWIGANLSGFGIISNSDSLRRLAIPSPPKVWSDLGDPHYLGELALANPAQSGSVATSLEMLLQQQISEAITARARTNGSALDKENTQAAIADGWSCGWQLLMKIGANARYFTDSSSKIALDVAAGDAAAGMTIDFYGRFESEAARHQNGTSHVQYLDAVNGSSIGADPIGLYRGAPHPDIARAFIAFVLSEDGQKLWNWKRNTPGGPEQYALRRLPILPSLYAPEFRPFRSDPDVNPYALAQSFVYHPEWTASLFRTIPFIFRVMCIDSHDELVAAWKALARSGFPPKATATFLNVDVVSYSVAAGQIKTALGPNHIMEVQLAKTLSQSFRAQYQRAIELAQAHQ